METNDKARFFAMYIIIAVLFISGCREKFEKPFTITYKNPSKSQHYCEYIFTDKNGIERYFYDNVNKYSVGDTIH